MERGGGVVAAAAPPEDIVKNRPDIHQSVGFPTSTSQFHVCCDRTSRPPTALLIIAVNLDS